MGGPDRSRYRKKVFGYFGSSDIRIPVPYSTRADRAILQAFALRCRRLCSPPRFFATRVLPVLARNQLPALSVASPLVVSTTDREPAIFVLRMLAAGTILAAIVQPEAAECVGTKRKKGTVVEEFYEVDCIKARRLVKGSAVECGYLRTGSRLLRRLRLQPQV